MSHDVREKSSRIAEHLARFEGFKQAEHIAYYLPVSGEADPTMLCPSIDTGLDIDIGADIDTEPDSFDKRFYLPVLHKDKKNELHFVRTDATSIFTTNRFGIVEPEYLAVNEIKLNKLDLVIMPLVGFDRRGNRIGMGGGFYDRTFAFKQNLEQGKTGLKPLLIGYAYEFQYSDGIKPECWDVKMDGVVTENGFFFC